MQCVNAVPVLAGTVQAGQAYAFQQTGDVYNYTAYGVTQNIETTWTDDSPFSIDNWSYAMPFCWDWAVTSKSRTESCILFLRPNGNTGILTLDFKVDSVSQLHFFFWNYQTSRWVSVPGLDNSFLLTELWPQQYTVSVASNYHNATTMPIRFDLVYTATYMGGGHWIPALYVDYLYMTETITTMGGMGQVSVVDGTQTGAMTYYDFRGLLLGVLIVVVCIASLFWRKQRA